jgi:hypothetical protein
MTQQDADSNKVNDGWDEEKNNNEEMFLEKPTEGRGIQNVLKGMGLRLPKIKLPSLDFFRKIFILVIIIVVLAVIGFILMYLKM